MNDHAVTSIFIVILTATAMVLVAIAGLYMALRDTLQAVCG